MEKYSPKQFFNEKDDTSPSFLKEFDPKNLKEEYRVSPVIIRLSGCDPSSLKGKEKMRSLLHALSLAFGMPQDDVTPELLYLTDMSRNEKGYAGEVQTKLGAIHVMVYPRLQSAKIEIFSKKLVDRATILTVVRDHFNPKEIKVPRWK